MGGQLIHETLPGALSRRDVRVWFDALLESDAYEHGHEPYSGSWATLSGLAFVDEGPFESLEAALGHVDANAVKWEAALAVRYRTTTLTRRPTFNGKEAHGGDPRPVYVIDYSSEGRAVVPADQLAEHERTAVANAATRLREAAGEYGTALEALRRTTGAIERLEVFDPFVIAPQQAAVREAQAAKDVAERSLADLSAALAPKLYAETDGGLRWLVGGVAAS